MWPRLEHPLVCQNPIGVFMCHSPRQMLGYAYTIYSYDEIQISCTIRSRSPAHSVVSSLTLFLCKEILCIYVFFSFFFCGMSFVRIDSTLLSRWAVPRSALFYISLWLGPPGILLICLFASSLIIPIAPTINGSRFKVPSFLYFYFQVFVITYIIILSNWYVISCWHWHIT